MYEDSALICSALSETTMGWGKYLNIEQKKKNRRKMNTMKEEKVKKRSQNCFRGPIVLLLCRIFYKGTLTIRVTTKIMSGENLMR